MKIGFTAIDTIPEGKTKFDDPRVKALVAKDQPKKVTPYYVEFIKDEFIHTDMCIVPKENILDVLILDIEKCEARLERSESDDEKALMKRCLAAMEKEIPLCDMTFSPAETEVMTQLSPVSYKPVLQLESSVPDLTDLISMAFDKAGKVFFYTSGPKEVHAWMVDKGSDIVTCAGKIHTDLARGFIKGDIVKFDDYLSCHSFNDCKKKNLVNVVDRDYIITPGDVIEIRFNV